MTVNSLKEVFFDWFYYEGRCVNCEHSILFGFFVHSHKSTFRTEVYNLETKSPKKRLNLEKTDSLFTVKKKHSQKNYLNFAQKKKKSRFK